MVTRLKPTVAKGMAAISATWLVLMPERMTR
jgi:hypothetical protein